MNVFDRTVDLFNAAIRLLIGRGANINVSDNYGKKPLDYAKEGHKEIVGDLTSSETVSESEFSNVCSSSKSYQEVQKLEEENLISKRDDAEAIKKGITEHIQDRLLALIHPDKKEKYQEKTKTGPLDVADYGKILHSKFGENVPQNIKDNVHEYFNKKLSNLFVLKEKFESMILYHYVLIETDKINKNYGRVIYSGCGQDPPEIIGEKIISTYFDINEENLEEFAHLTVEESKTFHDAVRKCKLEALRSFVGENSVDNTGWTPLHHAAYVGNKEVLEFLVSIGVNLKVKDASFGRMPVHIAAREGHNDVIELLLSKSLEVNGVDKNSWTPLHYATWGGHLKVVKLLIERGFDIHVKEAIRGRSPIHIAAGRGYMDIVDLFLKSGAEIINDTDREGLTSLHYAAWKGHLDIVKHLVDRKADIHAKNIFGTKPIHIASSGGHINIIEFLLDQGAKVNDLNYIKQTPLHFAAVDGQLGTVDFLLCQGANVNNSNNHNYTPLHLAAAFGHLEVVKILLEKGAKIEVRNNVGKTPSELARANGYTMVADYIRRFELRKKHSLINTSEHNGTKNFNL